MTATPKTAGAAEISRPDAGASRAAAAGAPRLHKADGGRIRAIHSLDECDQPRVTLMDPPPPNAEFTVSELRALAAALSAAANDAEQLLVGWKDTYRTAVVLEYPL